MSHEGLIVLKVPPYSTTQAIVLKVPPNAPQGVVIESGFSEFRVSTPHGTPESPVIVIIQDGREIPFQGSADRPLAIRLDAGEIAVTVPASVDDEYHRPE